MPTAFKQSAIFTLLAPMLVASAVANVPDAGRLVREQQQQELPVPVKTEPFNLAASPSEQIEEGGQTIVLKALRFKGNTIYRTETLNALVGPLSSKPYDLASIYQLAERVQAYYRENGYAFATTFIAENALKNGVLTIHIFEGMYGDKTVTGASEAHNQQATRFVQDLKTGTPIYLPELERRLLILNEQPGYKALPILKPSESVGRGDLVVELTRDEPVQAEITVNNHGNRYTGYYQARASATVNSGLLFGDQLSVSALQSNDNLQNINLNYNLALLGNGLRGLLGYGYTRYELGKEFKDLQASGDAQLAHIGLSYPVLRSMQSNLTLSAVAHNKRFFDEQKSVNSSAKKHSNNVTVELGYDHRTSNALHFGRVGMTKGEFNAPTGVEDTAKVNGEFTYVSADLASIYRLSNAFSIYSRVNGQYAQQNLDSSESFILGGPYGVRAYPNGEGSGDEGVLGQFELRYQYANSTPYLFLDYGIVRTEHNPTNTDDNRRSLSGVGLGLRYQANPWYVDGFVAHKLVGGDAEADPTADDVNFALLMSYRF